MAHEGDMVSGRKLGNDEELRILLIGKSGHGKSATGNMILGFDAFEADKKSDSVTNECRCEYGERFGRKLMVVDTPGLCDTKRTNVEVKMELVRSLGFTAPGFHVIIFVLFAGRFTKECSQTKNLFFEWFGSNVEKHAMIILTNWKKKDGHPSKHFEENDELEHFLQSCGNRVVGFNNESADEAEKNEQVKRMISFIDDIIKVNNNTCFTTFAFQLVQKCIQLDELPVFRWLRNRILPEVDETHDEKEQGVTETKVKLSGSQFDQRDASFNGSTSLRNPPDMNENAPPDVCTAAKNKKQIGVLTSAKEARGNTDMKQVSSEANQRLVTIPPNQIYRTSHDDIADSKNEQVAINKVKRLASDFENTLLQQRDCTLQDAWTTVKEEKTVNVRAWSNRPKESTDTKQVASKTQRQPMTFQSNQVGGTPFDVCHAAKVNEQLSINKVKRLASDFENTLLQQRDGTLHDCYTTTKEKKPVKLMASSEEAKEKHVMKQDALMFRQQPMTIQSNPKNGSSLYVSTTKTPPKEAEVLMSSDEVKQNPLPNVCKTAEEMQKVEDFFQNDKDINKSKKDDKAKGNVVLDNSKKDYKATRNKFFDNAFVKRIMKIYDFFTSFILGKKIPLSAITSK